MGRGDTGNSQPSVNTEELTAGLPITEDGLRRTRAELQQARARHTPQRRDRLRAQVGLPPENRAA